MNVSKREKVNTTNIFAWMDPGAAQGLYSRIHLKCTHISTADVTYREPAIEHCTATPHRPVSSYEPQIKAGAMKIGGYWPFPSAR